MYDSNASLLALDDDSFLMGNRRGFSLRSVVPQGVRYVTVVKFEGERGNYTLHAQVVIEAGSTTDTAALLNISSPAGEMIDAPDEADYFGLDVTDSRHVIIEARSATHVSIGTDLLDADGGPSLPQSGCRSQGASGTGILSQSPSHGV